MVTKRKQGYQENVQTGKDGLYSLIWAKNCILNFIDVIKDNDTIIIYFSDNRRKKIYYRYLKDYNFKLGRSYGRESLIFKNSKQICGGGEYDGGVGFAIGIDRLLTLLE